MSPHLANLAYIAEKRALNAGCGGHKMSEELFLSQKSSQDMAMLFHPDEVRCFEANKNENGPPSATQYLSTSN